jgi:hypothetical protein
MFVLWKQRKIRPADFQIRKQATSIETSTKTPSQPTPAHRNAMLTTVLTSVRQWFGLTDQAHLDSENLMSDVDGTVLRVPRPPSPHPRRMQQLASATSFTTAVTTTLTTASATAGTPQARLTVPSSRRRRLVHLHQQHNDHYARRPSRNAVEAVLLALASSSSHATGACSPTSVARALSNALHVCAWAVEPYLHRSGLHGAAPAGLLSAYRASALCTATTTTDRLFALMCSRDGALQPQDVSPFIERVVEHCPALCALSPLQRDLYVRTVVTGLFAEHSSPGCGPPTAYRLTRSQFAASRLPLLLSHPLLCDVAATAGAPRSTALSIEQVDALPYFSYRAFHVAYARYAQLAQHHPAAHAQQPQPRMSAAECSLTLQQVQRYESAAFGSLAAERIFAVLGGERPTSAYTRTYEDFVRLLMAEQGIQWRSSLEFWFAVLDRDQNGVLSAEDLRGFHTETQERAARLSVDLAPVPFEHLHTQLIDAVAPHRPHAITRAEWCRSVHAPYFVNALLHLHRYARQEMGDVLHTTWETFIEEQYSRAILAQQYHEAFLDYETRNGEQQDTSECDNAWPAEMHNGNDDDDDTQEEHDDEEEPLEEEHEEEEEEEEEDIHTEPPPTYKLIPTTENYHNDSTAFTTSRRADLDPTDEWCLEDYPPTEIHAY